MSSYSHKTVKQLKQLLKERGLNFNGNKDALIERLLQDDDDVQHVSADNSSCIIEAEGMNNADIDNEVVVSGVSHDASGESEQIRVLHLQIRLQELKLQEAQLRQTPASADPVSRVDFGGIKTKLPGNV
jgi:hypothetical protein